MITNNQYKIISGQIAKLFCGTDPICAISVKERIITNFNNETFTIFLTNIQYGRFYILKYSHWTAKSNCRNMKINVTLTDAVTGEITRGYWEYDNRNCGNEQYYYPDLNTLISRRGYQLIDPPIKDNSTPEITKPRLIYNAKSESYGITYVPPTGGGGGGGGVTITPPYTPPSLPPAITPDAPAQGGFDIKSMLENPIVLIGIGVAAYLLLIKK
jgi:hypothetical protein